MIQTAMMTYEDGKFITKLSVDEKRYNFIISNIEEIPSGLKQSMKAWNEVPAVFKFEPADQFAYYISDENLTIKE